MSEDFPWRRREGTEGEGRVMMDGKWSEAAASSGCGPTTNQEDKGLNPGILRQPGDAAIFISDFQSLELWDAVVLFCFL